MQEASSLVLVCDVIANLVASILDAYMQEAGLLCVQTQMGKGFQRVQDSLDDIALDSPLLKTSFHKYKQQAQQQGWLTESYSSTQLSDS